MTTQTEALTEAETKIVHEALTAYRYYLREQAGDTSDNPQREEAFKNAIRATQTAQRKLR